MRLNSVAVIGVFATLIMPVASQATNRFGVVCVTNKTDAVVFYRYK